MKRLIFLLFLMIIMLPAFSATWQQIDNKRYIDIDSIETYKTKYDFEKSVIYSFWIKSLNNKSNYFNDIEKKYNKTVWYDVTRTLINCSDKTITTKSFVFYDLNSHVITSHEVPGYSLDWESIVPDSIGEEYYYNICTN